MPVPVSWKIYPMPVLHSYSEYKPDWTYVLVQKEHLWGRESFPKIADSKQNWKNNAERKNAQLHFQCYWVCFVAGFVFGRFGVVLFFFSPKWRGENNSLNLWVSSACLVAAHASTHSRLSPVAANPLGCSTAEPWVFTDLCPTLHTVPSVSRLLFSPSLLHHLNY